jgi:adenylosuccinate synthase
VGDEGKSKIVDLLTPNFDRVRYQGGHNASHHYANGRKPAAAAVGHPPPGSCVIGNGVVVDPRASPSG